MQKILAIEDSADFQLLLRATLKNEYAVDSANSATEASGYLKINKYDLILLDLGLPDSNGFDLIQKFRILCPQTPIILLSGRSSSIEKARALDLGAEDYIVKPFDKTELLARIKNKIKRAQENSSLKELILVGPFKIDFVTQRASLIEINQSTPLHLTPIEFRLLSHFVTHPGVLVTREDLVKVSAGDGIHILVRTVDKHICSLRKKLGEHSNCIKTAFKEGYRFELVANHHSADASSVHSGADKRY